MSRQLINIAQLAAIIHKSPLSVGNDITRNPACLPPFAKIGNKILFDLAKVEAWIEAQFTNKNNDLLINSSRKEPAKKRGRPRLISKAAV